MRMILTFKEWLNLKEMVGTGAIYDPTVKTTDFNWWGDPKSMIKSKKKKKKRKKNASTNDV